MPESEKTALQQAVAAVRRVLTRPTAATDADEEVEAAQLEVERRLQGDRGDSARRVGQ